MIEVAPSNTALTTWRKQHRVDPFYNTTGLWIPPYACLQLRKPRTFREGEAVSNTVDLSRLNCQHLRAGKIVWDVTQCNAQAALRQDPAEFVFNGPLACKPLGYGEMTADYPAQVLHDGALDRIENFTNCGPVADEWFVRSTGTAFTCMSHDIGKSAGNGTVHTIWVKPRIKKHSAAHGTFAVGSTVEAGELCTFGTARNQYGTALGGDEDVVQVVANGLYLVSFSGRITAPQASRGDTLLLSLRKQEADEEGTLGSESATGYSVSWTQEVFKEWDDAEEENTEVARGTCHVAFSGFENLTAGSLLGIRNMCEETISIANGVFTVIWLAERFTAPNSTSE